MSSTNERNSTTELLAMMEARRSRRENDPRVARFSHTEHTETDGGGGTADVLRRMEARRSHADGGLPYKKSRRKHSLVADEMVQLAYDMQDGSAESEWETAQARQHALEKVEETQDAKKVAEMYRAHGWRRVIQPLHFDEATEAEYTAT